MKTKEKLKKLNPTNKNIILVCQKIAKTNLERKMLRAFYEYYKCTKKLTPYWSYERDFYFMHKGKRYFICVYIEHPCKNLKRNIKTMSNLSKLVKQTANLRLVIKRQVKNDAYPQTIKEYLYSWSTLRKYFYAKIIETKVTERVMHEEKDSDVKFTWDAKYLL